MNTHFVIRNALFFYIVSILLALVSCKSTPNPSEKTDKVGLLSSKPKTNETKPSTLKEEKAVLHQPVKTIRDTIQAQINGMRTKCLSSDIEQWVDSNVVWKYYATDQGIEMLIRTQLNGTVQRLEIYALQKGTLIYAFEQVLSDYSNAKNNISWNCEYFFQNGKIADYVSTGHGETEHPEWEPQSILNQWAHHETHYNSFRSIPPAP